MELRFLLLTATFVLLVDTVFLICHPVTLSIPDSLANSFAIWLALPPVMPCSLAIYFQFRGGGADGSDCKSLRTFSLSHVTLLKSGEWDFVVLGLLDSGVGSKYCCLRLCWYDRNDSSSISVAIAADRFSASFSWSRYLWLFLNFFLLFCSGFFFS